MQALQILFAIQDVTAMTTLSRTSIWRKVKLGEFPEPLKVGSRSIRWRRCDLESWLGQPIPNSTEK